MAVRFAADAQDYTRALALGALTGFSMSGWVKIVTDRNGFSTFLAIDNGTGDATILGTDTDGVTMNLANETGPFVTGTAMTVGSWYWFGFSCAGASSTATLVWRLANSGVFTTTTGTMPSAQNGATFRIGESPFGAEFLNGSVEGLKLWTFTASAPGTPLTAAELQEESWIVQPVRTSGLRAWYPLLTPETTDYSGNAQTLTATGAGAAIDLARPQVPWTWRSPTRVPMVPPVTAATVTGSAALSASGTLAAVGTRVVSGSAVLSASGSLAAVAFEPSTGVLPSFVSAGTYLDNTSTTAAVAVPAGALADMVAVVGMYLDGAVITVTPPTGFVEAAGSPVALPAGGGAHSLRVWYKRLTGADSGTYDFTWGSSRYHEAQAVLYKDVAAGDPFEVTTDTALDLGNSTVSPPVSLITGGANRLLVWAGTNWGGGTWSAPASPAGFVKRAQGGFGLYTIADAPFPTAGDTGDVSGTNTGSDKRTAWIGALIGTPASGGATVTGSAALSASGGLAGQATVTQMASAALSDSVSLVAAGTGVMAGSVALSASGALSASSTVLVAASSTLSASGSLVAAGFQTVAASSALSGSGALVAAGTRVVPGVAALSADVVQVAQARVTVLAQVVQSGTSALAAVGTRVVLGSAALSASGSLVAGAAQISSGWAALSATSSATVAGSQVVHAGAALVALTGLTANPDEGTHLGSAALEAVATLAVAGTRVVQGAVQLSASGALAASGSQVIRASLAHSAGATLAATGTRVVLGSAALAGVAQLDAAATSQGNQSVQFSASGVLTVTASLVISAASSMAASGALAISSAGLVEGSASLSAASSLAASGRTVVMGVVGLSASGAVVATATLYVGRISLAASGNLAADGHLISRATIGLVCSAHMSMLATVFVPVIYQTGTATGLDRPTAAASGGDSPLVSTTSQTGAARMTGGTSRTGTAQRGPG